MAKAPVFVGKDKHGKSIWQLEVYSGVKVGGEYQRVFERFHGSKTDARKRMREIETDLSQGVNVKGGKCAFDQYAKQWLEDKRPDLAPRTLAGYEREVGRLCEILGNTPLENINAPSVRKTINTIRKSINGRNGKPSEATVRTSYTVLSGIMRQAERDDLIRRNPCTKVDPPKAESRERRSMTAEQYTKLLEKLDESTARAYQAYKNKENHLRETGHQNKERHALRGIHELAYLQAVRIAHATGMRPSEIFALQWKHVDYSESCIHVEQATETVNGGSKETKTRAGKRDIYVRRETLAALAQWRKFQADAANSLGIELSLTSWVCCSDTFTQVQHTNFNRWWRSWATANGFDGWEVYELRHTQTTLLIDAGANVKTVQTRMGHSSPAVTLNIYTHSIKDAERAAADLLPHAI